MARFFASTQRGLAVVPARHESGQKPAVRRLRHDLPPVEIAPEDPLMAYFLGSPGVVELRRLHLDSPALRALQAAGVVVAIPLVSQGELVGVLNLGARLSQQDYSADDRGLLNTLATQAAPAVRVAQLVRRQKAEARARERIEQELRIARIIQQTLLPKELPSLPGWQVEAYYQPARAVGGDFYDFLSFDDGRLGIVVGDVTDKGVPAALLMATTRSILRTAAQTGASPGQVLEQANELLCPDIPPNMFVTCLYAILTPETGRLLFANAGHDLPYLRGRGGARELRATGMPLGLMPGMRYEERESRLAPGDTILFYSDGLVEAHNPNREMFGIPRLIDIMKDVRDPVPLIEQVLNQLVAFTGPAWEQEDDVTLVSLRREPQDSDGAWRILDVFEVPSAPGNERVAMRHVETAIADLGLPRQRVERLLSAVAEATMNAMEHGNHYQADLPVQIEVRCSPAAVSVRVRDFGGGRQIPSPQRPNLEAKLNEEEPVRGWGLFLIEQLVDEMHVSEDEHHHVIELIVYREEHEEATDAS
jgi:serine phosphatase RsbU (regulator of sigma subunit)/anti-sigma regulatory factor (Ser/Thr protein kinase)